MDEAAVADWLERYVAAWRSYDPEHIRELFAEAAVYRHRPWDEGGSVLRGREAIVASWLDEPDEPGSWTAEYRPWAVDGERAVAVGVSRYFATATEPEETYDNVFLLRFDDSGRCVDFTELYMLRPG